MKQWLTIGEICRMFNLNVQTLHYYETIGLFVPQSRNGENNYRLYYFDQVYKLATIRYMKMLGYSLKEIQEHMDTRDMTVSLEKLKTQSEHIKKRWNELMRINDAILRKVHYTESRIKNFDPDCIYYKYFETRYYIPIGTEETLYSSTDFYFYPTVVFYKGDYKDFGALITEDGFDLSISHSPLEIPQGKYICGYHKGPYSTITETMKVLKSQALIHGEKPLEGSVNLNIIDQFIETDSAKYVTEVQIRLRSEPKQSV